MQSETQANLSEADWGQLGELRKTYLAENFVARGDYWISRELLQLYHSTFAQRIGWKWEAVLKEIVEKRYLDLTRKYVLFDFGCGTGIASQKVLEVFGANLISNVWLWDSSKMAVGFAGEKLRALNRGVSVEELNEVKTPDKPWILCLSHLINELPKSAFDQVVSVAGKADFVIWVEPGTRLNSSKLIQAREILRETMKPVAPCTHANICGMRSQKNQNHWCHFFAPPPASIFQSAFWKKFSERMRIDLRSLPVSYLVLSKDAGRSEIKLRGARVIGRPRFYTGFGKILLCNSEGVLEVRLLERNEKQLFKEFKSTIFSKEINNQPEK